MQSVTFEPIGFIRTPFKERFGTPRQSSLVPSAQGTLHLRPELNLVDALTGLESFSHVWLVFVFHQNTNKGVNARVHPPRLEGQSVGLFATRTPHRPNPIGLSVAKLEQMSGGVIHLSGMDLLDGTPILDIKPYLPSSDLLPNASAGWTEGLKERTLTPRMSEEAEAQLVNLAGERAQILQQAICEVLSLDPRPTFYKGSTARPNPYMDTYGFRHGELNVCFRVENEVATVVSIEPWHSHSY